jgi:hypothetical protein
VTGGRAEGAAGYSMQLTHGGTIPGSRPSFSPQYRYVPALRQLKQGGLLAPGEALSQRQAEEAPSRPSSSLSLSGSDHVSWHAPGSALSSPLLSLISFISLETWIIWSSYLEGCSCLTRGRQLHHTHNLPCSVCISDRFSPSATFRVWHISPPSRRIIHL